jgi:hypothetical protein
MISGPYNRHSLQKTAFDKGIVSLSTRGDFLEKCRCRALPEQGSISDRRHESCNMEIFAEVDCSDRGGLQERLVSRLVHQRLCGGRICDLELGRRVDQRVLLG